ncbi:hypothetical protein, partial [Leyella stercorea]|uniref:hypothetical protein n=1 Tax=Leyella stercorea TaxID=363265 RepID=UPI003AF66524
MLDNLLITKHKIRNKYPNSQTFLTKRVGSLDYLGSAELLSVHRQRVADVAPHSDDNDEKPPDFGQGKTKFPQELHHV